MSSFGVMDLKFQSKFYRPIRDRKGQISGAVIVFRDSSAARKMTLQLAYSAHHDVLTSLPNRLLLNDRINQAIALAVRHSKKVAVLFLDLEGFKHINDSLAHPMGDRLLQSIAQRLVDCVRASDTVSRQGGDEFVVLLSEVEEPRDAADMARRMLQATAEPHSVGQHNLHITVSVGVSVYPGDGGDTETLIKNADTAMYQAKEMDVRAVILQARVECTGGATAIHRGGAAMRPGAARTLSALPTQGQSQDR